MTRIPSFLMGIIVGGLLVFGAMKYHLVRSTDGFHLIPKLAAGLQEAYVDIRQFKLDDWAKHRTLAAALIQADKEHLMQGAAESSLRDGIRSALESLTDAES